MMIDLTPEALDRAAAAMWDTKASIPWAQIPEAWKPFYREWAKEALKTATFKPRGTP